MASTISLSQRRSTSVTKSLGAFSLTSPGSSWRESCSSPARRATSQTNPCSSSVVSKVFGMPFGTLAEVLTQVLGAALLAEEVEGLHLDLPDALARDVELAADLLEGAGPVVLHPEAQLDDLALPLGKLVQRLAQVGLQQRLGDRVRRGDGAGVLEKVAELRGVVVADRGREAYGPLADLL